MAQPASTEVYDPLVCERCNGPTKELFTSRFCAAECDRAPQTEIPTERTKPHPRKKCLHLASYSWAGRWWCTDCGDML